MSSGLSQQRHRRDRGRRSTTTGLVTKAAATAVVAYGAYRAAQWYFDDDSDEQQESEKRMGEDEEGRDGRTMQNNNSNARPRSKSSTYSGAPESSASSSSSSWLSAATNWVVDAATSSVIQAAAAGISSAASVAAGAGSTSSHPGPFDHGSDDRRRNTLRDEQSRRPKRINRRQRLVQCRQKTLTAFKNCLPSIQPVIEQKTNTSQLTKELKEIRRGRHKQKQEQQQEQEQNQKQRQRRKKQEEKDEEKEARLWEQIMIETTTRMVSSSYAYTLLMLSLTVQLHYIGYRMMRYEQDQQDGYDEDDDGGDDDELAVLNPVQEEAQTLLLESHEYFVEEGLPLLITTIRRSVETVLLDSGIDDDSESDDDDDDDDCGGGGNALPASFTDPTSYLTESQIEEVLYHEIPDALNYSNNSVSGHRRGQRNDRSQGNSRRKRTSRRKKRNWMRFVWPEPYSDSMDEIWDIGNSPVWDDAQRQILEKIWFDILRDEGWSNVFVQTKHHNKEGEEHGQPMAKVLAQFKKSSTLLFEMDRESNESATAIGEPSIGTGLGEGGSLAEHLQRLPTVLELGDVSFGED